jgi:hypothetical protein
MDTDVRDFNWPNSGALEREVKGRSGFREQVEVVRVFEEL